MIPVEQRQMAIFDEHGDCVQHGDCLTACVASIFELPLDEVPFFVEHDDWHRRYHGFVAARGLCIERAWINVDEDPTQLTGSPGDRYWIATVYSPRGKTRCTICKGERETLRQYDRKTGDWFDLDELDACWYCEATGLIASLHAVVMHGRELVWDPHPQREMGHLGFISGEQFGVPDPARVMLKDSFVNSHLPEAYRERLEAEGV